MLFGVASHQVPAAYGLPRKPEPDILTDRRRVSKVPPTEHPKRQSAFIQLLGDYTPPDGFAFPATDLYQVSAIMTR